MSSDKQASSDKAAHSDKPAVQGDNSHAAEETKRKFREALERKKQRSAGKGTDHLDGESSIHAAHGPASHQREFRRKSG